MSDILQRILARKREEIDERRTRVRQIELLARLNGAPRVRGFTDALRASIEIGQAAVDRSGTRTGT